MAGPAPKTKLWTAHENAHKPSGLHLLVAGQVEVSDANKTPVLTETKGDGSTLALDLTIEACSDPAIQVLVWKAASFHRVVDSNQFSAVAIRWDNKTIATIPVIDDRERAALLDKQTKAQNATVGKPKAQKAAGAAKTRISSGKASAKTVAKKVAKKAAKKAARKAVKKAPKAVGGWAKKAKKKAAKKASRKAAKKSAVKKFMKKIVKALTPARKKKKKR